MVNDSQYGNWTGDEHWEKPDKGDTQEYGASGGAVSGF